VLNQPEVQKGFARIGTDVVATDPVKFSGLIRSEVENWAKVVKETGVQAN